MGLSKADLENKKNEERDEHARMKAMLASDTMRARAEVSVHEPMSVPDIVFSATVLLAGIVILIDTVRAAKAWPHEPSGAPTLTSALFCDASPIFVNVCASGLHAFDVKCQYRKKLILLNANCSLFLN